jgi:hypothetical protein
MNGHAVNVDRATFDSFGDLKSLLVILSPNASVQTDFRIVRDLDSFFYVLDSDDDQGGTESLLVIYILGRVDSVKNDRRVRCQVILRRSCNSTKTCGTLIEKGFVNRLISSREELLSVGHSPLRRHHLRERASCPPQLWWPSPNGRDSKSCLNDTHPVQIDRFCIKHPNPPATICSNSLTNSSATLSSTTIRAVLIQICPLCRSPPKTMLLAASLRSALSKTMAGAFPPSSNRMGLICLPATSAILDPTSTDPVKLTNCVQTSKIGEFSNSTRRDTTYSNIRVSDNLLDALRLSPRGKVQHLESIGWYSSFMHNLTQFVVDSRNLRVGFPQDGVSDC